jgi:hypothetical protein
MTLAFSPGLGCKPAALSGLGCRARTPSKNPYDPPSARVHDDFVRLRPRRDAPRRTLDGWRGMRSNWSWASSR